MAYEFGNGVAFRNANIWNLPLTEFDNRSALFNHIIERYFADAGLGFSADNKCRFLEIGVWKAGALPPLVNHFGPIFDYVGLDPYGELKDDPYKGQFWETSAEAEAVYQSAAATFERHEATLLRETSDSFFARDHSLFDVVFVDGDHRYAGALKDMENGLDHLKPGGLLIVDDVANNFHPEVEWAYRAFMDKCGYRFSRSGVQPLFFQMSKMSAPVMLMFAYMQRHPV
jgi:SAM-dependent methyltransferase